MPAKSAEPARADWRRSSACVGESHCVEVADLGDRVVGLRNSQVPETSLILTVDQWRDLTAAIKNGALQP